ncbi:MAG: DNA polymerase I [Deltaproteobacteria bacterium]|nr:DNA polymerase I [Deltaproteobacteria bacterium]
MTKTIYLVDASLYIYRSFHALPHFTTSTGQPTGAIFGFVATINKILREKKPEFMVLAFDAKGPTFRHQIFSEYKANRPPMPQELIQQQDYIRRITDAFKLPRLETTGLEADDLIATLATQAQAQGVEVVIVAADKDFYQILSEGVTMYDPNPKREGYMSMESLKERFGVTPSGFLEAQGLMGDTTDNYSGIPGVGEKTAIKLIQEYGTLDNIYENLDNVKQASLKKKLIEHKEEAYLARDLAHLKTDADLKLTLDEMRITEPDVEELRRLYKELDFTRFLADLEPEKTISYDDYHLVDTEAKLASLTEEIKNIERLSVDLETTSTDPMRAGIVGMSLAAKPHRAFYIPMAHQSPEASQLPLDIVFKALGPILESEKVLKVGQNIKYDYIVFRRHGIELRPIGDDSMIASYLLDPGERQHNLDRISRTYLYHNPISYLDVVGDKKIGFETVSPDAARDYACEDADLALILSNILRSKLRENTLLDLYEEVELPLIEVLAEMEMNGVKLDVGPLQDLSRELAERAGRSEARIYELAGREFNINSPKQVGEILFEDLKLPQGKKTKKKTGYSTDEEVLTKLAEVHPLPAQILSYRMLVKLRSTYADALPQLINPKTGRVHTSYNQAGTATGRLSSSDPNLQNIPIRTEEGLRIRAAFVPEPGSLILAADYSQIELRVLAHCSAAEGLLAAFSSGEDIHTRTAAEIFNVFPDMVTSEMRRDAKAINFGIIYGKRAFGLAKDLGIERRKAQAYIDQYFARYSGIKDFIDKTIEQAKIDGYVSTLFNRKRRLPNIKSRNSVTRAAAERMAINTLLQGTAADIIKKAMIAVHRTIKETNFPAKLIMQVHDELVFEVAEESVEELSDLVRREMEGAVRLKVPLLVDISFGSSWAEAH